MSWMSCLYGTGSMFWKLDRVKKLIWSKVTTAIYSFGHLFNSTYLIDIQQTINTAMR